MKMKSQYTQNVIIQCISFKGLWTFSIAKIITFQQHRPVILIKQLNPVGLTKTERARGRRREEKGKDESEVGGKVVISQCEGDAKTAAVKLGTGPLLLILPASL